MQVTATPGIAEIPISWFSATLKRFSVCYVELIFLAIALRLLGLIEPFVFQVIIDRILPFQREYSLVVVVIVFICAGIFQLSFGLLSQILSLRTANEVTHELGRRLYSHLFNLPFSYFRKWSVGETIARISETDRIRAFLVSTTTGTFLDMLFLVIYVSVLFSISVDLTAIVLLSLPLQVLVYIFFGPVIRRRMRKQFDSGAVLQNQIVETLSGINTIKALNIEHDMIGRLEVSLKSSLLASYKVNILSVVSGKLTFIIQRLVTTLIILFGAQSVFSGEMTLGQLIAFHLLVDKVTSPIANFSRLWESWQNIKVSRQRLGDIVNTPIESNSCPNRNVNASNGELVFSEVSFRYPGCEKLMEDFSFIAAENTLTLILGETGSGKSTFARLAAGIELPQKGLVYLGGQDMGDLNRETLRSQIAYVPQESYLFAGTIRENLAIGMGKVSDDEMMRTLSMCSAGEMIGDLPLGLDTNVGDRGSALSGGQRQKIAIARGLIRSPKVLILDEPTNSLDHLTISCLTSQLAKLKSRMTVIVVTHQPGHFVDVDQTLVLGTVS